MTALNEMDQEVLNALAPHEGHQVCILEIDDTYALLSSQGGRVLELNLHTFTLLSLERMTGRLQFRGESAYIVAADDASDQRWYDVASGPIGQAEYRRVLSEWRNRNA